MSFFFHIRDFQKPRSKFFMTILKIRNYQGKVDRQAIINLLNACEAFEQLNDESSLSEILFKLNSLKVDNFPNVRLWEYEGNLIGLSFLDIQESPNLIDSELFYYIHPKQDISNLAIEMSNWAEKRVFDLEKARTTHVNLRVSTRDDQISKNIFLKKSGFIIDRYFLTMAISLEKSLPKPLLPDGFKLLTMADIQERQSWVEMYNQSFIDHWAHHNLDINTLQSWLNDPNFQQKLNLIAVAPDSTFAAFCNCQIKTTENLDTATRIGWIELLGTRRGFRRMGLGKAILLAGLEKLKSFGVSLAKLSVDAESITGANRLYKSVGFELVNTWLYWQKNKINSEQLESVDEKLGLIYDRIGVQGLMFTQIICSGRRLVKKLLFFVGQEASELEKIFKG